MNHKMNIKWTTKSALFQRSCKYYKLKSPLFPESWK